MPIGSLRTLKEGQVAINYQYNTATGVSAALIYNPQKDILLRGKKFTFVITVADEKTYNWVQARVAAIYDSFLRQEDTMDHNCAVAQNQYAKEQYYAAVKRGLEFVQLQTQFLVLDVAPMPKEALESPFLMCYPLNIRGANMTEWVTDDNGQRVLDRTYWIDLTKK